MAKNTRRTPPSPPPADFPPVADPFPLSGGEQETASDVEEDDRTEDASDVETKGARSKTGSKTASGSDSAEETETSDEAGSGSAAETAPLDRARFFGGWFASLFGLFLCAACASYLFCWWNDYDVLSRLRFSDLWRSDTPELNVIGNKLGGFFAYAFLHKGFGVAGLLFPVALVMLGLQCLNLRHFRWKKFFWGSVFALMLSSTLLGSLPFLQANRFAVLGGEVGFFTAGYLKNVLGYLGFYALWGFLFICFLVLMNVMEAKPYTRAKKKPAAPPVPADGLKADTPTDDLNLENADFAARHPETGMADASAEPRTPINSYIPAEERDLAGVTMTVVRHEGEAPDLRNPNANPSFNPNPTPNTLRDGAAAGLSDASAANLGTISSALNAANAAPAVGAASGEAVSLTDIPITAHSTISDVFNAATEAQAETEADANGEAEALEADNNTQADGAASNNLNATNPDNEVTFEVERPTAAETTTTPNISPAPKPLYGLDTPYDPTLDLSQYRFPTLDLMEDLGKQNIQVDDKELESNKNRIIAALQNYGIRIDSIKATVGPTVTLYEIVPAAGIRISKIKNLEDDIALTLSALGIRIIAPIPGKGTIGIEVPNIHKQVVPMRDMISCDKFQKSDMGLPIALGRTISNDPYVTDLTKMPHLLVAGATGQGKSVGLNAIIASLLYKMHPAELKFVMVDPKKVELSLFGKIERHYLAKLPDSEEAIITDTAKVIRTLKSLCKEMDMRYDLLKDAETRTIKEYNQKFRQRKLNPERAVDDEGKNKHRFLPYIVLVIDEFADLIMTAGRDIEMPIARLAQLARAIGIHLVIATQRPSVNIITGTIKANFPARLAFKVSSKTDSRTILDCSGADQLIGRGDMLLSNGNELVRIQCAYIDTPEIERITEYIGEQHGYPTAYILPDCPEEGNGEGGRADIQEGDRDPLFEEVAHFVVASGQGSTSAVQRKFKLGYNRAGRIIDQLEDAGIVGPLERNNREVRIKDATVLEQLLNADRAII